MPSLFCSDKSDVLRALFFHVVGAPACGAPPWSPPVSIAHTQCCASPLKMSWLLSSLVGSKPAFPFTLGEQFPDAWGSWTHFRGTAKVRATAWRHAAVC